MERGGRKIHKRKQTNTKPKQDDLAICLPSKSIGNKEDYV
jgi:hypothetical protein